MKPPKDSTPSPRATADDGEKGDGLESSIAKTAGFVVFSGIAISILKGLNPLNKNRNETTQPQPIAVSTQPVSLPPPQQPVVTVSIDEIKEANGLSGDTIYAGKKLIIP